MFKKKPLECDDSKEDLMRAWISPSSMLTKDNHDRSKFTEIHTVPTPISGEIQKILQTDFPKFAEQRELSYDLENGFRKYKGIYVVQTENDQYNLANHVETTFTGKCNYIPYVVLHNRYFV